MLKNLFVHASRYFTASIFSVILSLLLTKFYTTQFSVADFGVMSLYMMVMQTVALVSTLSISSSALRVYSDYRDVNRDKYISCMLLFIILISLTVLVSSIAISDVISSWISPNSRTLFIVVIVVGVILGVNEFFKGIITLEEQSSVLLHGVIVSKGVGALTSVSLQLVLNLGVLSRFSGEISAGLINFFYYTVGLKRNIGFKFQLYINAKMVKETLFLAIPNLITILMSLAYSFVDRIFIKYFYDNDAVGIYSFSLMVGQLATVFVGAVSQAVMARVYNCLREGRSIVEIERIDAFFQMFLVACLTVLIYLSDYIIIILADQKYNESQVLFPYVLMGVFLGSIYKLPSIVLNYNKKVWIYPWVSLLSFAINFALNFMLVPVFGVEGAAISTLISVFVYSAIICFLSRKYFSLLYVSTLFVVLFFSGLIIYFGIVPVVFL
mgnify:CR=1 FL=1